MKLSFVGAVLLISVLSTDAQWFSGSQDGSVSVNYNQQASDPRLLPDSVQVQYSGSPRLASNGVNYYENPNPQYPPRESSSSFFSQLVSPLKSVAEKAADAMSNAFGAARDWASSAFDNTANMMDNMVGMAKNWFGSCDRSNRYPDNRQVDPPNRDEYFVGVPSRQVDPSNRVEYRVVPNGQVVVSSYSQPLLGSSQVDPSNRVDYRRFPNQQVGVPSGTFNGPSPFGSQVGDPSDRNNVPPRSPPLASIQVTASDSNSGPPPANNQPYDVRMQAPPQNEM